MAGGGNSSWGENPRVPPPLYGTQEGVGKGGEESKMQDGDKSDAKRIELEATRECHPQYFGHNHQM